MFTTEPHLHRFSSYNHSRHKSKLGLHPSILTSPCRIESLQNTSKQSVNLEWFIFLLRSCNRSFQNKKRPSIFWHLMRTQPGISDSLYVPSPLKNIPAGQCVSQSPWRALISRCSLDTRRVSHLARCRGWRGSKMG